MTDPLTNVYVGWKASLCCEQKFISSKLRNEYTYSEWGFTIVHPELSAVKKGRLMNLSYASKGQAGLCVSLNFSLTNSESNPRALKACCPVCGSVYDAFWFPGGGFMTAGMASAPAVRRVAAAAAGLLMKRAYIQLKGVTPLDNRST